MSSDAAARVLCGERAQLVMRNLTLQHSDKKCTDCLRRARAALRWYIAGLTTHEEAREESYCRAHRHHYEPERNHLPQHLRETRHSKLALRRLT